MSKRTRDAASPGATSRKSGGYAGADDTEARRSSTKKGVKEQQDFMRLTKEGPVNPDTKDFCGAFAALDIDNSWDLSAFKRGFKIEITKMSDELVEFDMIGIDPPLANAFRRILIAEVPTIAISNVTIYQNTGVIHDENLAHRLGLVPIVMEPDDLQWRAPDADFTEDNSVLFTMRVECDRDRKSVYSGDLKWEPVSDAQEKRFRDNPPRPISDDILVAKLRSGQEIELSCNCEKGIGKEHAKWSPVCTATYRLMPHIKLTKPVVGKDAEKLKKSCPKSCFDIEDGPGGGKAIVADARSCTTCRECITSFDGEAHGLVLGKEKNHYLFSIEAVGQVPATKLFERALEKLQQKCEVAKKVLATTSSSSVAAKSSK